MVGTMGCQAGELGLNPSVIDYFFFHFSQKYFLSFVVPDE